MEVLTLRDVFWAHRGLLSDKWEQYIPIYESELRPHLERKAPVALLEIGVENGGSLEIWQELLPPHSRVVGMDINERCRELKLSEGIELHIGDATQKDFVSSALGETSFDIIIDDGSHHSNDIIASFEILFGRLKPGGTYFVEDLHCSYWPAYGGGFRAEGSSIEWAKRLVDAVNADYIESTSEPCSEELAQLRAFNTEIARIAFFNSMLVVQKYIAPKYSPFARLLTGAEVPVFDPMPWVDQMPAESLGNLIVGRSAARRLVTGFKKRLDEKDGELNQQQQKLNWQEQELKRQEQELKRQEQERRKLARTAEMLREKIKSLREKSRVKVADLQKRLASKDAHLKFLRSSTSWKVTAPLRRARKILEFLSSAPRKFHRAFLIDFGRSPVRRTAAGFFRTEWPDLCRRILAA